MTILELTIYSPKVLTSFGDSLLYLGRVVQSKGGKVIVCFPQFREWMSSFKEAGIQVEIVPIRGIMNISAIKSIRSIYKKYRVDVVHTHFGLESHIIACIAKLFSIRSHLYSCTTKVVWHWRSIPGTDARLFEARGVYKIFLRIKRKIGIFFYRLFDKFVSMHIAISDEIKNLLVTRKIAVSEKVKVIYNGIDMDKYIPDSEETNLSGRVMVGNVANFMAPKDHWTFLDAANIVLKNYPDTKFMLVGDGPTRSKIEQYAEDLGIRSSLIFTGMQENVQKFINKCSFIVFSSLHEGFGNVTIEAMALKKPVIGTNIGGVPIVVKDGETGFLVERKDAEQMAEKIKELIEHPDEIKRLGKQGRLLVEQKFTLKRWTQQVIDIFNEIYMHNSI